MKRLLYAVKVILLGLFIFSFLATFLQVAGSSNPLARLDNKKPLYDNAEEYDPSLSRLNSTEKLELYCDSLYLVSSNAGNQEEIKKDYTDIVSSVVRKRFFHGYSYYGFSSNYIAFLASKATIGGLAAIVIPDDILKYSYAACSQQTIVMMEVLRSKGFDLRKITFQGKKEGHFCFEIFFDGEWHFYDTNMEPDISVLKSYGRPGIAFLADHQDVLLKAYNRYPSEKILDVFPAYSYGEINEFPAPRAMLFQKLTKLLSYTIWLFFLAAFLIVHRRYIRITNNKHVWNSRIHFPPSQRRTSSSYYPDIAAPRS